MRFYSVSAFFNSLNQIVKSYKTLNMKKRLNITKLEVKSFSTSLQKETEETIKGGTSGLVTLILITCVQVNGECSPYDTARRPGEPCL